MVSKRCTTCNSTPPFDSMHKSCSNCKSAFYCSAKCQSADWRYHKHVCKEYSRFLTTTPRPSKSHRLCMSLPVTSTNVEFAWVECGQDCSLPEDGPEFDGAGPEEQYITQQLKRLNPQLSHFVFDHRVEMWVRAEFEYDGSVSNECIMKVMNGHHKHDWKGMCALYRDSSAH